MITTLLASLKEDGKQWLKLYGSGSADNVQFRDGLLMIGQKGLHEGNAVEFVSRFLDVAT